MSAQPRYRIVGAEFGEPWRIYLTRAAAVHVARNMDGHHPQGSCYPHRVEEVPDDPS